MGKLKNGILGAFSGKVGSVVGYEMRGKAFIKSANKPRTGPPSAKQLANQAKFQLFNQWRNPLSPIFAITFLNQTAERSAQNAAHRANKHIIKGEFPNFSIDKSEVIISTGTLPALQNLEMERLGNQLLFNWDNAYFPGAAPHDLVAVLIDYGQTYQFESALVERDKGNCSLTLVDLPGTTAWIYAAVLSNNRLNAANSICLGKIII